MTGIRKRSPTNKEFKRNFQGLASTKTKKGHLTNQEKEASDNAVEKGTLIRISKEKLYENGWEVEVGTEGNTTTYSCSYGDGVLYLPDSTETDLYYVPKEKTEVELTIDKQTQIYTITKINTFNKKPLALYENKLTISTNTNTNTNANVNTSIEVSNDSVNIKSDNVTITNSENEKIDLVESQKKVENLLERIQILEDKVEEIKEDQGE